jgi:hypothetical protein
LRIFRKSVEKKINALNAELNPICHLLALLGAYLIFHVSSIRVNKVSLKSDKMAGILHEDHYMLMKISRSVLPKHILEGVVEKI